LADIVADAYQLAGRLNGPGFLLDFLYRLCRRLDPVQVPSDCINPAMIRGISRSIGIPFERLFVDDDDASSAGTKETGEG
jgi:hypothetical protein